MSTLRGKYRLVRKTKEKLEENDIRINANGAPNKYIAYAKRLFLEKNFEEVNLSASGWAVDLAVTCAEVLRRRIKGLAQINEIYTREIIDEY